MNNFTVKQALVLLYSSTHLGQFVYSGESSPVDKKSPTKGQCTDDEEDDCTEMKANKQNGEHEDG